MGIRDRPTSPRPSDAERLIGSIRRECVDHIVVLGERHLRHVLLSYMKYYNEIRTHLSLEKDAPVVSVVNSIQLAIRGESDDPPLDVGSVQADRRVDH